MSSSAELYGVEVPDKVFKLIKLLDQKNKKFSLVVLNKKNREILFYCCLFDEEFSLSKSRATLSACHTIELGSGSVLELKNVFDVLNEKVPAVYGAIPLFDHSGQIACAMGFFVQETKKEEMEQIVSEFNRLK
jgi:hypothetical protein